MCFQDGRTHFLLHSHYHARRISNAWETRPSASDWKAWSKNAESKKISQENGALQKRKEILSASIHTLVISPTQYALVQSLASRKPWEVPSPLPFPEECFSWGKPGNRDINSIQSRTSSNCPIILQTSSLSPSVVFVRMVTSWPSLGTLFFYWIKSNFSVAVIFQVYNMYVCL